MYLGAQTACRALLRVPLAAQWQDLGGAEVREKGGYDRERIRNGGGSSVCGGRPASFHVMERGENQESRRGVPRDGVGA